MSATDFAWRSEFLSGIRLVQERLTPIWLSGRRPDAIPGSGYHWTLPGFSRPVSVDRIEAFFLYNLAVALRIQSAVEIGTGFGYSTLWLAGGVYEVWGDEGWVGTIDSLKEGGLGAIGTDFAAWAVEYLGLGHVITRLVGTSPTDVAGLVGGRRVELAFIDGNHQGEQPLRDFMSLTRHLAARGVVVWHDFDKRYSVPRVVEKAAELGFAYRVFPTSCGVAVSYREPTVEGWVEIAFRAAANHDFVAAREATE